MNAYDPHAYDTHAYDALPDSVTEIFGEEATAERAYDLLTVDVPTASWIAALEIARDKLGLTYFDWLSAVDEPGTGFRVSAHVASVDRGNVRRLLVRTTVPHSAPSLPSAVEVYAGAAWHERETYEMFGVTFTDHPHLVHLLLPENFEGHPLRKDFVLAARVAKAWPGAKEPGESHDPNAPKRRQMLPPGVPDPNDWGPLKGQLPPAPSRPARGAAAAGDRPARRTRTAAEATTPRRTRTAGEGLASRRPEAAAAPSPTAPTPAAPETSTASPEAASPEATAPATGTAPAPAPAGPRRNRSASAGSASQRAEAAPEGGAPESPVAPAGPRRTRSASAGSASQRTEAAPEGGAPTERSAPPRTRSSDAPWHHARPAFDEEQPAKPETPPPPAEGEAPAKVPAPEAEGDAAEPTPGAKSTGDPDPTPDRTPGAKPTPDPDGGDSA
ncbi:NADH-quinone oxidoreductase subunit C [Streptomyces roseicoloratus]|uniref:NADH-quinone oxidoreductase subunit C n=1 Tax=Streptomyces roseicoloratus TaxID=2508722 RepID=UPI0013E91098|nr:NADH-quinone oxidoreductase subunit C [Streptomyces roseicoloratus]